MMTDTQSCLGDHECKNTEEKQVAFCVGQTFPLSVHDRENIWTPHILNKYIQ